MILLLTLYLIKKINDTQEVDSNLLIEQNDTQEVDSNLLIEQNDTQEVDSNLLIEHNDTQEFDSNVLIEQNDTQEVDSNVLIEQNDTQEVDSNLLIEKNETEKNNQESNSVCIIPDNNNTLDLDSSNISNNLDKEEIIEDIKKNVKLNTDSKIPTKTHIINAYERETTPEITDKDLLQYIINLSEQAKLKLEIANNTLKRSLHNKIKSINELSNFIFHIGEYESNSYN